MLLNNFSILVLFFIDHIVGYPTCVSVASDPCVCLSVKKLFTNCFGVSTGYQLKETFSHISTSSVHTIEITNCNQLTSLPARVFGTIKTKHLVFQTTSLFTIENNALKGFEFENSLETVNFFQNNFTTFNFKSITKLKKLHGFRITNDKLMEIPENAFFQLPLIRYIDLSHNRIKSIQKNAFYSLPFIRLIDLRANKLKTIDEDIFNLNITLNRVTILLNSNEISFIHKNAFKNLRIQNLELENNQLETLSQDVFEPLLDYFNSSVYQGVLYVKGNPFKCDSSIHWLVVTKCNLYKSHVDNFICENNGKRLSQLNETDL